MSPKELLAAGKIAVEAGRFDEALAHFDGVVTRLGEVSDRDKRQLLAEALGEKADALRASGALEKSMDVRDELIARFRGDFDDYLRTLVSISFDRNARALHQLERYEEQLRVREAELAWYDDMAPNGRPLARLEALAGRAIALSELSREAESFADWSEVLAGVGGTTDPRARWLEASALVYRAAKLRARGEHQASLADLEQLQARFSPTEDPYIAQRLAQGLLEQVWVWREMGMSQLAESPLERLTTEFASAADPIIVNVVTRALTARAEDHRDRGALDAADQLYDAAIARAQGVTDWPAWDTVTAAALGKASVLAQRGAVDDGLAYLDRWEEETVRRFPDRPSRVSDIVRARMGILTCAGRDEDVVSFADEIVERFAGSDGPTLRQTVALVLFEKAQALGRLGRASDSLSTFDAMEEYSDELLVALDQQIRRVNFDVNPLAAQRVGQMLLLRACILSDADRDEESANTLDALIEQFADSDDPTVQAVVDAARTAREELDLDEQ